MIYTWKFDFKKQGPTNSTYLWILQKNTAEIQDVAVIGFLRAIW